MAFPNRSPASGWANAHELIDILEKTEGAGPVTFQREASISVLHQFTALPESRNQNSAHEISRRLTPILKNSPSLSGAHGTRDLSKSDVKRGMLADPEAFFCSRASVREYADAFPSEELIKRAVRLAMQSPSACNRQPWSVYYTNEPRTRDTALKFQSGNKGFGQHIPCLMVVAIDQRAFMPGQERYQHWIDGGMFAMSLIYALHSLGLVSCALNWSQSSTNDRAFRKAFRIADHDSIIMMLGIGFPKADGLACASVRRPIAEVLISLEQRR